MFGSCRVSTGAPPLVGLFSFQEEAGRGGYAHVWRASCLQDGATHKTVAVKIYTRREQSVHRQEFDFQRELFFHENAAVGLIPEPMVFIPGTDYSAMVMEFIPYSLDYLLQRPSASAKCRALEFLAQVLMFLWPLHEQGFVHRDLKPQNIGLRTRDGGVCLLDFGLSVFPCLLDSNRHKNTLAGTLSYMSTDSHNQNPPSWRDDIWNIIYVFFEVLAGPLPWSSTYVPRRQNILDRNRSVLKAKLAWEDELMLARNSHWYEPYLAKCVRICRAPGRHEKAEPKHLLSL
eukprot:g8520.t1